MRADKDQVCFQVEDGKDRAGAGSVGWGRFNRVTKSAIWTEVNLEQRPEGTEEGSLEEESLEEQG